MSINNRDSFLFLLYKKSKLYSLGLHPGEINQDLRLTDDEFRNVVTRLIHDGFIEWLTTSSINITPLGIDYVESNSNDEDVIRRKNLKMTVLNEYYKVKDKYHGATQEEISTNISIGNDELDDIIRYLLLKRYIEHPYIGPYSKITFSGIDVIENNMS